MKDNKQNCIPEDSSNSFDETSANLKDIEDNIYSPFKLGKVAIGNLINKYFTKKFTEDIDYLQQRGGINWIENSLKTSFKNGISDNDNMLITRVGVFDSNQPAPEKPISNSLLIRLLRIRLGRLR